MRRARETKSRALAAADREPRLWEMIGGESPMFVVTRGAGVVCIREKLEAAISALRLFRRLVRAGNNPPTHSPPVCLSRFTLRPIANNGEPMRLSHEGRHFDFARFEFLLPAEDASGWSEVRARMVYVAMLDKDDQEFPRRRAAA